MTLAEWARKVKDLDGWKCVICGREDSPDKKVRLESHHVEKRGIHPELATIVSNGVTLCRVCHRRIHGMNFMNMAYPDQFMQTKIIGSKIVYDYYTHERYDESDLRRKMQEYVRNRNNKSKSDDRQK